MNQLVFGTLTEASECSYTRCKLLCTQPTMANPCSSYAKLRQFSNYLASKLEDFHLAGLIVGAQAPEELILRGITIRDPGIVEVP